MAHWRGEISDLPVESASFVSLALIEASEDDLEVEDEDVEVAIEKN